MTNVDTSTVSSEQEQTIIDEIVNLETKRKVKKVKGAEHYGIMTACCIDGEFVLVSEYDVAEKMINELRNA